ncbi:MAG: choice-of-anchor D domain-containing protein, partial [Calditrichia bacterium]
ALYKLDVITHLIVDTISTIGTQPQGISYDGQYIYYAMDDNDGDPENIYIYDQSINDTVGYIPITDPISQSPRGLAWDGQFLWLVADPVGTTQRALFKIDVSGGGTPNIQILTTTLNYGLVAIGDTSTQVLAIQNIGDADVTIDSIDIDQSVFLINVPSFPIQIAPGGSYNLDVSFAPVLQGPVSGTMTIYNNDPLEPQIPVSLQGQGQFVQPTIWLSATGHNFGSVWVPIEGKAKWVLNIANTGNENLEVVDLILNEPEFSVGGFSSYPIVIAPNDTFPLSVFFEPTAAQAYGDSLIIASTDPANQYVRVGLIGTGVLENYSSGYVFWNYQVGDNPSAGSFQEYEVDGLKPINDINGDGRSEVVIATENYWLLCIDGNGSGITDTLWSFSSYISNSSAGSIGANSDYGVQDAIQVANDLNGDGYNDVVIATGGGNEHVYAIDGTNGNIIWQYGTDDPNSYGLGDFEAVDVKRDFNGDGVEDVLAIADGNDTGTGYKKA